MTPTKLTRQEKVQANKGIAKFVLDLLQTSPKGPLTVSELLGEVLEEFPLADLKSISNACSNLKRAGQAEKLPSAKGRRGARWTAGRKSALRPIIEKKKEVVPDTVWNAEELGISIITVISNMKKRINEHLDRISYLEKTLKNERAVHRNEVSRLEGTIRDKDKLIKNMRDRIKKKGDHTFQLKDVANFTGKEGRI